MIVSDGNNHVVIAEQAATAVIATQTTATVVAVPAARVVIATGIQGPEGVAGSGTDFNIDLVTIYNLNK